MFLLKSLSPVERNYEIHNKEMLAIIRTLEEWRHFLEGVVNKFEIGMDHCNLQYFMTSKKLNQWQAQWSLFLSRFDFTLHHQPGHAMGKPDALSRREDHGASLGENDNITLLTPELFVIWALEGMTTEGEEVEKVLRDIWQAMRDCEKEESVVKAVKELRKGKMKSVRAVEW